MVPKVFEPLKFDCIFLRGFGAAIAIWERIGTLPALQSLFTGVKTVSVASGLDRVCMENPVIVNFLTDSAVLPFICIQRLHFCKHVHGQESTYCYKVLG